MSARYLCSECGDDAMLDNLAQLRVNHGPRFLHWRRRLLHSFGIVLVDTPPPPE